MRKIILASASPRRKELLEKAGVSFIICTGNGEEVLTTKDPEQAVFQLSQQKAAMAASDEEEGTLIIGADTIVVYDGRILGKPADKADAVETLQKLQNDVHQVFTGVTVLERKNGSWIPHSFAEKTDVYFYPVSAEEIREYVESGEPMDKAGSYGIQGSWSIYVKGIHGDYSNVVGLPVARLLYEMKKAGIDLREK
ncbi:MAG: septum formation inhibitor Maf [Clostridiales bacterium]|nr:septum formation inhibitor Maf [Candidatus Blautia equi]